jgi:polysaccharide biosynthesis/export protein
MMYPFLASRRAALAEALRLAVVVLVVCASPLPGFTQSPPKAPVSESVSTPTGAPPGAPGYVIGVDDVLSIVFYYEKDLSADVVVRPDGKISLPLMNEIHATGLTPEELRASITKAADQFVQDPRVSIVVKAVNSRKVFITGQVEKPGPYPLGGPTSVLQLIAMAGGLRDWADSEKITIVRIENGQPATYAFNYKDLEKRKNVRQNIELKPGDTVIVP